MGGRGFKMHGKVVWPGFSHAPAPRHVARVGRNEPCPCGSSRKYKDCHEKDGESFLAKLAREEDRRRYAQLRVARGQSALPWYRRLFSRDV